MIDDMSGSFENGDHDDGNLLPSVPVAYSTKRRGWDGDHLELSREQPSVEDLASHTAVNLGQFRNEQIGIGYQAKHVVRQRSVPDTLVDINDMTQKTTINPTIGTKRKHEKLDKVDTGLKPVNRLQQYLNCKGMRQFRKELTSIESSSLD